MDIFRLATPIVYGCLTVIWLMVVVFCVRRLRFPRIHSDLFMTLMAVLALDGFRTFLESLYFGLSRTSLLGVLPSGWSRFLAQSDLALLPKSLSLITGVVVLALLVRRFAPQEMAFLADQSERIQQLKQSIEEARAAKSHLQESEQRHALVVGQTGQMTCDFRKDDDARRRVEDELAIYRDHLEHLVQERTREVQVANRKLEAEVRERKAAEQALRENEARLRLIADNMIDVITQTDAARRIVYCSPSVQRVVGYTPEEVVGRSVDEWIHPSDLELTLKTSAEARKAMVASARLEHRWRRADGEYAVLESNARLLYDDRGQSAGGIFCSRDITARKRAEEALQKSEERLRLALEGTTDGIWDWNLKTDEVYFSPRYYTMLGYEPGAFPASCADWLQLLHPDDMQAAEQTIRQYLSQPAGSFAMEFRMRTKGGGWCWILGRGKVVQWDDEGNALRMAGSHTDISERKQALASLRQSEEKFRAAFENAVVGRGIMAPQGAILQANRAIARILGMSRGELLAKTWQQCVHPDFLPAVQRAIQGLVGKQLPSAPMEIKLLRKDGSPVWSRVYAALVRGPDDRPLYLVVDVEDISHLKEYEERLRKYQQIVSASQDLMALINRDFKYEAVNESFLAAHQRTAQEVLGRSVAEVVGEDFFREQIRPKFARVLAGETVNYRKQFDYKQNGRRCMDVSYFPFFDENGEVAGIVLNARDVTETLRLEEQLTHAQKLEALGTLAGGVAHEINNPINGIMNYAQLIVDQLDKDSPASEFAAEIIHETTRIATIVRNLLTFARREKQSHSPARITDIVAAVLSLVQTIMRHDHIVLELDIPDDLPPLKCRSQQIQQVLMNLITNARDALNERFPAYSQQKRLRVFARLLVKHDRNYLRTTVEDFGGGIPVHLRDRIFDPFFTTKPKETGTGLGLSISYGIVKDHGGELLVESTPGQYTRVSMDLPVDDGGTLTAN